MVLKELIKENPQLSYTEMGGLGQGFGEAIPYFIYGYFAVQSLYLLGSVYFRRYTFILTTVVGALLFFILDFF